MYQSFKRILTAFAVLLVGISACAQVGDSRGVVLVPKLGVNLSFDVKRKRDAVLESLQKEQNNLLPNQ